MHDCCQVWSALRLIVKRVSSRVHFGQCAGQTPGLHYTSLVQFQLLCAGANLGLRQHLLLHASSPGMSTALCVRVSVTHGHDADKPWQVGR